MAYCIYVLILIRVKRMQHLPLRLPRSLPKPKWLCELPTIPQLFCMIGIPFATYMDAAVWLCRSRRNSSRCDRPCPQRSIIVHGQKQILLCTRLQVNSSVCGSYRDPVDRVARRIVETFWRSLWKILEDEIQCNVLRITLKCMQRYYVWSKNKINKKTMSNTTNTACTLYKIWIMYQ